MNNSKIYMYIWSEQRYPNQIKILNNSMLSKVSTIVGLSRRSVNRFSVRRVFYDFLYRDDKSSEFYKVATQDPTQPLQKQYTQIQHAQRTYEVSQLDNGITVLTESASEPTRVDLGVLLDVGTRDEVKETSGSLLSLKNTYYKTVVNTNETVNYGIIQMSGGDFSMDYNQEAAYYRAHCLSHDAVDVFRTIVDCALEPRSVVAASVGIEKNKGTFNLEKQSQNGETFNENVFKTAFGQTGLGMPLRGFAGNVNNLTAYTLQKFQQDNIVPQRIFVCAAGVENHQEFVDLARETLSFIQPYNGSPKSRLSTNYEGGELRTLTDSNTLNVALLFPSVNWNDKQLATFQVLSVLLEGQKLYKNVVSQKSYFDGAESVNVNFSDAGLFGVRFSGAAESGRQMVDDVVGQLKSVANGVNANDLQIAKNVLKRQVFQALERQADRLEEAVNNYRVFGQVRLGEYAQAIDSVSESDVSAALGQVLRGTPTFVAQGGLANRLQSFDELRNQLN